MSDFLRKAKEVDYLHHAYVVLGSREHLVEEILAGLARHFDVPREGNPDLVIESHNALGVDEAHTLSRAQTRGSFGENQTRKIFIITADSITSQAQNALLKTFEEPTSGTHFFIILPRIDTLLPTLRSRVFIVDARTNTGDTMEKLAQEFLAGSLETRFAISKKLADKKKDDVIDRESVRAFADALEVLIAHDPKKSTKKDFILALYEVKKNLASQGSSPKMLLDNLAITLASSTH